ncbi:MAG: hypothetical protein RMJ56_09750 [Gemmataceae bacterium]|nr:hypothetical protein [Gemmata sp.]MDW8197873.1 hypothetical protein [Gemmataceae bacterium]
MTAQKYPALGLGIIWPFPGEPLCLFAALMQQQLAQQVHYLAISP